MSYLQNCGVAKVYRKPPEGTAYPDRGHGFAMFAPDLQIRLGLYESM